jgi:dipeptidase E
MSRRLLLLSNSRDSQGRFLQHPQRHIRAFLGARVRSVMFIPFAAVSVPWDEYAERAREPFAVMGYALSSIHAATGPLEALRSVEAIVVGGGNTFHLLSHLYESGLLDVIRELVNSGVPYIGWSAGSVIACPTIRTTNDMPIVEPQSLDALGVVPFQINAHYSDYRPESFQGETRSERIAEFLAVNPERRVVGLPEGTMLQVERDRVALLGEGSARVFSSGQPPRDVGPGEPLDVLLTP